MCLVTWCRRHASSDTLLTPRDTADPTLFVEKKLGRVVCSAIRAQGVGRGKIEPYVKVKGCKRLQLGSQHLDLFSLISFEGQHKVFEP